MPSSGVSGGFIVDMMNITGHIRLDKNSFVVLNFLHGILIKQNSLRLMRQGVLPL